MKFGAGTDGELWEETLYCRRQDIRSARADLEKLMEALALLDNCQLMDRIERYERALEEIFTPRDWADVPDEPPSGPLWPAVGIEIGRYVAIQRGLIQLPDNERLHHEWIDRELRSLCGRRLH